LARSVPSQQFKPVIRQRSEIAQGGGRVQHFQPDLCTPGNTFERTNVDTLSEGSCALVGITQDH